MIDARPGISAVVYVRSTTSLTALDIKQDGEVVNADRTKTLSLLLGRHNSSEIIYPDNYEITSEIFDHLKTTKKIRERSPDGTMTDKFCKSSDNDHWVHSMNYAMIAAMVADVRQSSYAIPIGADVSAVRLNSVQLPPTNKLFYW